MFLPCSLRALCLSSPPCRVAVATIAAPRYPARGLVGAIPPAHPRGAERPQGDQPHSVCPPCTLSAPSLPSGPPGGLPFCRLSHPRAGLTARLRFAFNPARGFFGGNTPARPAA